MAVLPDFCWQTTWEIQLMLEQDLFYEDVDVQTLPCLLRSLYLRGRIERRPVRLRYPGELIGGPRGLRGHWKTYEYKKISLDETSGRV